MLLNTPLCNIGWTAPDFELPDADGKTHSRDMLAGPKGFLVAFICNHCPYVREMVRSFVSDSQKLEALGINTVAIM